MTPLGFRWCGPRVFPQRGDGLLQGRGIQIKGPRVDIHKNRGGPQQLDNFGRGDEGKRRGEDGVPGADLIGQQRHQQGVGARGAGNGVFDSHVGGQPLLQLINLRSQDILPMGQDPPDSLIEGGENFLLLSFQVDKIEAFLSHNSKFQFPVFLAYARP